MHLLAASSTALDDLIEPVDLGQRPGDILILSYADTDLSGLASAWQAARHELPSVRLANLRDLRHPLSVDLWLDKVGRHAKVILVRLLGGLDWWRYGIDRLSALAREHGIVLAVLPGEDRDDPRLAQAATLPARELERLLRYFREGGTQNLASLLRALARYAGADTEATAPRPLPRMAGYLPGKGAIDLDELLSLCPEGKPRIAIIFYRSTLLASDCAPIDRLCEALRERGLAPAPLVVPTLKENAAAAFVRAALARLKPTLIVTTTAFAAGSAAGEPTVFDEAGVPVLQAMLATTARTAWEQSPRGLGSADLAMNVVLPELDGRILQGALSFKGTLAAQDDLCFRAVASTAEPDRIAMISDRIAALAQLALTPRKARRLAILLPDYPGAADRCGYAVGLDVPASVVALLADLKHAGYCVSDAPQNSHALLEALADDGEQALLPLDDYARLIADLPRGAMERIDAAWGKPHCDPEVRDGAFRFRARQYGNVLAAFPPDRGRAADRRADYHDAALPPRHALLAFALWLRQHAKVHALIHMGAHGTLEWLPGKAVALTSSCFPELMIGALPVIYPFIVSNPGEAAQAKRRIAAVTIGHLPPPLVHTGLLGEARELESLVDEYAQADGLDRRRRERLARLIVAKAQDTGLAGEASVRPEDSPDDALRRIDAWLCDLKDLAIKDGLHVFGRAPEATRVCVGEVEQNIETSTACSPPPCGEGLGVGVVRIGQPVSIRTTPLPNPPPQGGREQAESVAPTPTNLNAVHPSDPAWLASAASERAAVLAALDVRRIAPGPAGSPARGRRDVLPTGRNMFTADPRTLPTSTATELGRLAADEVIRCYMQGNGELPRACVIDLWGSATLRTGGEEIAQGLALMGCRPLWDGATGRVTGVEVLPTASMGRPRVDVTWRISGLFRDLFPAQIALLAAAARAVAAREESDEDNPLAAAWRASGQTDGDGIWRIFGTAPGAYGAGVEDLLGRDMDRDEVAERYLAAASHAYAGAEGEAAPVPNGFEQRVATADLLVHGAEDPGRDLLEGSEDAAFIGGFAAAARFLGGTPDVVVLDTSDPHRPRARPLAAALARIVRSRATNARFIAGQMRHGPRGAAEFAETVDRLVDFAETTGAVSSRLFDIVHDAYVADTAVREFLLTENPAAAAAIAARLAAARARGYWHPRRNDVDATLAALCNERAS